MRAALQSCESPTVCDSFANSALAQRWLSEQCPNCGMIFMLTSQDRADEKELRRRLQVAATQHSGYTKDPSR